MKNIYMVFIDTTKPEYKNKPKFKTRKVKVLESLDKRLTDYSHRTGISKNRIINNLLMQRLNKIDKTSGRFYLINIDPVEKIKLCEISNVPMHLEIEQEVTGASIL